MGKYLFILLACVLVCGGWMWSRERNGQMPAPVLFDNMREQDKTGDQTPDPYSPVLPGVRPVPARTIAMKMDASLSGSMFAGDSGSAVVFTRSGSSYLTTGKSAGSYGNSLPVELGGIGGYANILARGKAIYVAHCTVCHGTVGDGKGAMASYPEYPVMPSFRDEKLMRYPLGQLYHSTAKGQGNMPAYEKRLTSGDLWSVCAWVKVLQDRKEGEN